MMNKVANVLRSRGVTKGDRVAIYMPACPLAVASMLACARIGAIHSVVFAGFSAEALASRILDGNHTTIPQQLSSACVIYVFVSTAEAKVVITADQGVRGGKVIELKRTVVTAVANCPSVTAVLVAKRTGHPVVSSPLDVDLEEVFLTISSD